MRTPAFIFWVAATWVALAGAAPRAAQACTPPSSCITLRSVQPEEGATGVLRNVELRIDYSTDSEFERLDALPVVEDLSGSAVDVVWTRSLGMLRGKVRTPLAAQTTYRIRHLFSKCTDGLCADRGLCPSALGSTLTTFVTGDIVDESKPAAVSLGEPELEHTIRVTGTSQCGPFDRCSYIWKSVPLEAGHMLRLQRGEQIFIEPRSAFYVQVYAEGSRFAQISGAPQQLGGADYDVYVVDEAGNLSDPVPLNIPACAPYDPALADAGVTLVDGGAGQVDGGTRNLDGGAPEVDAGVAATADAGTTSPSDENSEGGCSTGKVTSRNTATWGFLLAIVVGARTRRRDRKMPTT